MNKAILSVKYPQYAGQLQKLGYVIIPSEEIPCKMLYERDHADLQCLILNDTAFVLKRCQRLSEALSDDYHVIGCGERFGGAYPDNVLLNAVLLDNKLICRVPSLDDKVKEYCAKHDIELIHINQGYTKCSCAVISDHALITADQGIAKTLSDTDIDVLTVGEGSISLEGAEYGFIGGASGYDRDKRTLFFCGDITRHPDYAKIKCFCDAHGTQIVNLSNDNLTDIGGIIIC